jgi:hypothetical protein
MNVYALLQEKMAAVFDGAFPEARATLLSSKDCWTKM